MSYELLHAAIHASAERGEIDALREFVAGEHPADLAAFVADLPAKDVWTVLQLLRTRDRAILFAYLPRADQVRLARFAPRADLAAIVSAMPSDRRAALYAGLNEAERQALLPALAQAAREDIRARTDYPPDTAGAIMTADYVVLAEDLSASEALQKLREEAPEKETIYRAYVIDDARRLLGSVHLRDLIVSPPGAHVRDIMRRNTFAVPVTADQEEVARRVARYDLIAIPVVDDGGRLVGIVTHDDALDVLQTEATEDVHRLGGSGGVRDIRSAGIYVLYRARIVWLLLLVFANIFAGAGIAYFEDTIEAYVALVFFLPLLIDSGGNAGSQSATLMVRSLSTGDVKLGDWSWIVGREVAVAALIGTTMAVAVSFLGVLRGGPEVAAVVALSMILIVMVGSVIGIMLPFLLTRFGIDPATASAPLVTSIADAVGVVIYFAIATAVLLP
jgi:magnesium transporter